MAGDQTSRMKAVRVDEGVILLLKGSTCGNGVKYDNT